MASATPFVIAVSAAAAVWFVAVALPYSSRSPKLAETSSNYRVSKVGRIVRRGAFILGILFVLSSVSALSVNLSVDRAAPRDIAFVLDVSRSMDAVDGLQTESRLERAKAFIVKVVDRYPQNRYSLTVFAGETFEAIPSTSDPRAFEMLVSGISTKYSNAVGTDLTKALKTVAQKYASSSGAVSDSPTALAVFLSDGGDAEDTPNTPALRLAYESAKKTLSVLAITFGSTDGANVPIGKDFMGADVYLRKSPTELVVTKANPRAAENIAKSTDGEVADEKDAFEKFEEMAFALAPIETNDAKDPSASSIQNGVSVFVLAALFAFVVSFVIPDKIPVCSKRPSSRVS